MNDYKTILSNRIGIQDIYEILILIQGDTKRMHELYALLYSENETIAYQAAWTLTHLSREENEWLYDKHDELINEVLICRHPGKRRLLLNLLLNQPQPSSPRIDFLDFCLERMLSKEELPGVQTLCMKIAYNLCRPIPELLQEFQLMLEMMEPDLLPVSIRTVRRKTLEAIRI